MSEASPPLDPNQVEQLLAAERAARAAAEGARRRLELLALAGAELSRSLEPTTTLQAIASTLVPAVVDWCRVDLVDAEGRLQRALTYHSDPEKARYGKALADRLRAAPGAVGSMAWAVATGQSHLAHFSPPIDFDAVRDRDLLTFSTAIGMRAYFMVPLVARGRTLGALAAIQAESGRELGPDDCALILELAQRASLALDNARLYAEAEGALQQARTANRAKDEFLAMLGHELRNPLAPIVNALELMRQRTGSGHVEERLIIERQVTHLSRLVDDLLDVSRITKGKVKLKPEPLDLETVVAWALEQTRPVLEEREHAVELERPPEPLIVRGDSVRLAQVFCNLLTNAAKFTPADGRIAIAMSSSGEMACVEVKDTGKGLSPDLLPRIFDLFVQGEQSSESHSGGLGLGLAIVKNLVHMHGGTVSAQSDGPGKGASFTIRLPIARGLPMPAPDAGAPAPDGQAAASTGKSSRILLVDDNHDAATTLAALLRETGFEVRIAADGKSALAAMDAFRPELAILDIGLPDMDGYELARALIAIAGESRLKLVALTGYGGEADRSRALASQFDEHLVKPVSFERLLAAVRLLEAD
jgi:signal transduction histidine kinase/CheY-like chemotaxis protein